jgi:hypothetical protein
MSTKELSKMKKIICELCDCMEFSKIDGMFVCHECGTKYSLEEAKSMMREVEGAEPAIATSVAAPVSAPVVNQNQKQVENLYVLASTAYDASNNQECEMYCNRIIEMDVSFYKAWFLKGKAVGWSSKLNEMRIEECAHSFGKALELAPQEEKERLKEEALQSLKELGIAAISLRKKRFVIDPSETELKGFKEARIAVLDALLVLLKKGNMVKVPEDYLQTIAELMSDAAMEAYRDINSKWNGKAYPTDADFTVYLDKMGHCELLMQAAIDTTDQDDEKDVTRYKNMIILLETPINKCSYKQEWNSIFSRYDYVKSRTLTNSAIAVRRKQVEECREAIANIHKKKADEMAAAREKEKEEKQARIKEYWSKRPEEKAKLDAELAELSEEKAKIDEKISTHNDAIGEIKRKGAEQVPSEIAMQNCKKELARLVKEISELGVFKKKEKNELEYELEQIHREMRELEPRIEKEKVEIKKKLDEELTQLREKLNPLETRKNAIITRIMEIKEIIEIIE